MENVIVYERNGKMWRSENKFDFDTAMAIVRCIHSDVGIKSLQAYASNHEHHFELPTLKELKTLES